MVPLLVVRPLLYDEEEEEEEADDDDDEDDVVDEEDDVDVLVVVPYALVLLLLVLAREVVSVNSSCSLNKRFNCRCNCFIWRSTSLMRASRPLMASKRRNLVSISANL